MTATVTISCRAFNVRLNLSQLYALNHGAPWMQSLHAGKAASNLEARGNLPRFFMFSVKAAAQGHPTACFDLAVECRLGIRCQQDLQLAKEYAERTLLLDMRNRRKTAANQLSLIASNLYDSARMEDAFAILHDLSTLDGDSDLISIVDGLTTLLKAEKARFGEASPDYFFFHKSGGSFSPNEMSRYPSQEANSLRRVLDIDTQAILRDDESFFYCFPTSKINISFQRAHERLKLLQGISSSDLWSTCQRYLVKNNDDLILHIVDKDTDVGEELQNAIVDYEHSVGGGTCDCCGKSASEAGLTNLLKCNRCRMSYVCSSTCQKKLWEKHHSTQCRAFGVFKPGDLVIIQGADEEHGGNFFSYRGIVVKTMEGGGLRVEVKMIVDGITKVVVLQARNVRHRRPYNCPISTKGDNYVFSDLSSCSS